jgi:predicted nucleotidyltransferase
MITNLFNQNMVKILTMFSISPGSKFTRKEIKEKTFFHNIPLDIALTALVNSKILVKEKRFFSLHWGDVQVKSLIGMLQKEYCRLKELPLKIYFILVDVAYQLSSMKEIDHVYLFGSFAKLIHTEKSDVDLAIILEKESSILVKNIKKEIHKIEKRYGVVIEEHFFEKRELRESDPLIKEIKRNRVVLF